MFKATNLKLDEGISELWEGRKGFSPYGKREWMIS